MFESITKSVEDLRSEVNDLRKAKPGKVVSAGVVSGSAGVVSGSAGVVSGSVNMFSLAQKKSGVVAESNKEQENSPMTP